MKRTFSVLLFAIFALTLCGCHPSRSSVTEKDRYIIALGDAIESSFLFSVYSIDAEEKITTGEQTTTTKYEVHSDGIRRSEKTTIGGQTTEEYFLMQDGRYLFGKDDSTYGLVVKQIGKEEFDRGGLREYLRVERAFDLSDPEYVDEVSKFLQNIIFYVGDYGNKGYFHVEKEGENTVLRYDEGSDQNVTIVVSGSVITRITAKYNRNAEFDKAINRKKSYAPERSVEWSVNVTYGQAEVHLPEIFTKALQTELTMPAIGFDDFDSSLRYFDFWRLYPGARLTEKDDNGTVLAVYEAKDGVYHITRGEEEEYYYYDKEYYCLERMNGEFIKQRILEESYEEAGYMLYNGVKKMFGEAYVEPDGKKGNGELICVYGGTVLNSSILVDAYLSFLEATKQNGETTARTWDEFMDENSELTKMVLEYVKSLRWEAVIVGETTKRISFGMETDLGMRAEIQDGDEREIRTWYFEEIKDSITLPK